MTVEVRWRMGIEGKISEGRRSRPFFISVLAKGNCEANILLNGKNFPTNRTYSTKGRSNRSIAQEKARNSPQAGWELQIRKLGAIVQAQPAASSAGDDGGQPLAR